MNKGARAIHNARVEFTKVFAATYEANMAWLREVLEEATRITHGPSVWLPRTPAAKKPTKRTFAHIGKQESTFREGSEKKKLKIEDFSTIDTTTSDANESIGNNGSRSLRPRRKCATKPAVQKKQQPKRNTKNRSSKDVESIAPAQDFKPPPLLESINFDVTGESDATLKSNRANNNVDSREGGGGGKVGKRVGFGMLHLCDGDDEEESSQTASTKTKIPASRPVPVIADDSLLEEEDDGLRSKPVSSSTPDVAPKSVEVVAPSPLLVSPGLVEKKEQDEGVEQMEDVFYSAIRETTVSNKTPLRPPPGNYETPAEYKTPLPASNNSTPIPQHITPGVHGTDEVDDAQKESEEQEEENNKRNLQKEEKEVGNEENDENEEVEMEREETEDEDETLEDVKKKMEQEKKNGGNYETPAEYKTPLPSSNNSTPIPQHITPGVHGTFGSTPIPQHITPGVHGTDEVDDAQQESEEQEQENNKRKLQKEEKEVENDENDENEEVEMEREETEDEDETLEDVKKKMEQEKEQESVPDTPDDGSTEGEEGGGETEEDTEEETEEDVEEESEKTEEAEDANNSGDNSRRGTYKVMVNNMINGGDGGEPQPPNNTMSGVDRIVHPPQSSPVKKGPKFVKPTKPSNLIANMKTFVGGGVKRPTGTKEETVKAKASVKVKEVEEQPSHVGNIVTNIKSFLNKRPDEQTEVDTEAEKQRKELSKKKAREEIEKKKQIQAEERKRQQQERGKRIAEQQKRRQEEEESKREQLRQKAEHYAKNQEQIRMAREQEQKKKQEERELKMAKLKARIQDQDVEKEKKVAELLQDEKRKQEILEKNNELERQKREQARLEKEKQEEEKRRKLEESKIMDEERHKREFEEKEKHRIMVEEKKKKDKENYLLGKQMRAEAAQQAEKEIADAKKMEEERGERSKREEERTKKEDSRKKREEARIRIMEETKEKAKLLAIQKPHIPNHLRTNPQVVSQPYQQQQGEEKQLPKACPTVPLVQRDSMFVDYGLDDFDSGDSTDDDTEPAKPVPSWAAGARLKRQLQRQFYTDIDPDDIFTNAMQPLRLEQIFNKNRTRYFKRTSSAHWSSPPLKGGDLFKPTRK